MKIQKQIEQLEQTINKAQSELEDLKQEASKPKPMFERGDNGEKYYFVECTLDLEDTKERNQSMDDTLYNVSNYFLEKDKHIAERVAQYYKNNNWFIRKAIEFADGYEWKLGEKNCFIYYCKGKYHLSRQLDTKNPTEIYMTEQNALKFKAWLEEYKPLS